MQITRNLIFNFLCLMISGFSSNAQSVLQSNNKYGLSDKYGSEVLKPEFDLVENAYFVLNTGNTIEKISASIPLFYVKQGGRYAYCYKVSFDSLRWFKEEYWIKSDFEFDSLCLLVIGTSRYDINYGYSIIKYKQGSKWGLLYVQTAATSGGGIFPSSDFQVQGLGKLYQKPAKYDDIYDEQDDYLFPTVLNDRYGLWDPIRNEEYDPEFDTIPVMLLGHPDHIRYVRKNKKWGVVRLTGSDNSKINITPCKCNEIREVWNGIYACTGYGDSITFFDTLRHEEYVPILNGNPLVFDSNLVTMRINPYGWGLQPSHPVSVEIIHKDTPASDYFHTYYNEIYFIDIKQHSVIAYNDTSTRYMLLQSFKNGLILKTTLKKKDARTVYQFYSIENGEFRFSFQLDSNYHWNAQSYFPKGCRKEDEWIYLEFYYYDKNDKRVTLGYYDHLHQKFSRRKPRYNSKL